MQIPITYRHNMLMHLYRQFRYAELALTNTFDQNCIYLKNPKIISKIRYRIDSKTQDNRLNEINSSLVDTEIIDKASNNRSDRRNKYQNKETLDDRKNKNRLKKRSRAKIHMIEEDEHGDSSYININNDNFVSPSLVRPAKQVKKKILVSKKNIAQTPNQKKDKVENKLQDNVSKQSVDNNVLSFKNPLSIQKLSSILAIPEAEIIKNLFLKGISVTINQVVDTNMAQSIAENYGFTVKDEDIVEHEAVNLPQQSEVHNNNDSLLELRAPIISIFGHVDHGKTTLVHSILNNNEVRVEAGGITQAIVANEVTIDINSKSYQIILLDTPGHEAFTGMRNVTAQVTDIGILVIAADDGLKPQSIEAIKNLQIHNIPFIIALNKIDKTDLNINRVKEELLLQNIIIEEWGGETPLVEISALNNVNINRLLETITILSEMQQFKANSSLNASGTILDSYLDRTKGHIASIVIKEGTLKIGDYILFDNCCSKVRAILDTQGLKKLKVGPSSVVEIWGLSQLAQAGGIFASTSSEKLAKKQLSDRDVNITSNQKSLLHSRITMESSLLSKSMTVTKKQVNLILKTDSQGSIDAVIKAFSKIPQEKVQLNLISISVGELHEQDIQLALVSNSYIMSFNLITSASMKNIVAKHGILTNDFTVIYDLIDAVEQLMLNLVEVEYSENNIGLAIVENIFNITKGFVAGCSVKKGKLTKDAFIKVFRNNIIVYEGKVDSLKRVKEDVEEVIAVNECGVLSHEFHLWQKHDEIHAFELIPKDKKL